MTINPYAYFDCLSIGAKLQGVLDNFVQGEMHLFAYLSCLLSLYRENPASDWNYQFAGTREGAPFSPDIDHALTTLQSEGRIRAEGQHFVVTEEGISEYTLLSTLFQNAAREVFLEGACVSVQAMPVGIIRHALAQEPELRSVSGSTMPRMLLEGPGLDILYEQFAAMSSVIGINVTDLMAPAIVWLTYLASVRSDTATVFQEWRSA